LRVNVQPAYANGFGVAGAHLSRHSGATAERPTLKPTTGAGITRGR